ncbi:SKP1/BTB/POZ domain superfamily [Sesbania bispinosa]|nr:SKP1/BTB/POZ domain superfamily [Sesbania bispinosa]
MSSTEKPSSKGQAWFCTTGLPSDIVVEVDDMTFHLHKFPLMSKSQKFHNLITQQEAMRSTVPQQQEQDDDEDEIVEEQYQTDVSAGNVASLRCAGEFLEMTEEFSEDNLISKTERFLSQHVLKSLGDSIKTLKSCEDLMPMAETLGITQRCIDSIVSRASSTDPALFGWPVSDAAAASASKQILWNGIDSAGRRNAAGDSWFEEMAHLRLPLFKRLILAMRDAELNPEIIETCVMYYAKRYIPGVSRSSRKPLPSSSSSAASEAEQKEILETVVSNLPLEKSSKSSTATRDALEKKIGLQLEEATLDDLLVPSYSKKHRSSSSEGGDGSTRSPALMLVGKLIDGYLSEIASDANLKPERFYNFAISLPDQARLFDDGLYQRCRCVSQGTSMGFGFGEGEDLRIVGLSEADTRGLHSRGAKREASAASGGSGAFLRAASAAARYRRDAGGGGDGSGAWSSLGDAGTGRRRGWRRSVTVRVGARARAGREQHVAWSSERESGASLGYG